MTVLDMNYPGRWTIRNILREQRDSLLEILAEKSDRICDTQHQAAETRGHVKARGLRLPSEIAYQVKLDRSDFEACIA